MTHEMSLQGRPFEKIASGQKTIELRLWDEKRQRIREGDCIRFTRLDAPAESLLAEVLKLHVFPDFAALYRALPLERCGYLPEEVAGASPADMNAYYSPEQQERCGVVGIEIRLLPSAHSNL